MRANPDYVLFLERCLGRLHGYLIDVRDSQKHTDEAVLELAANESKAQEREMFIRWADVKDRYEA